MHERCHDSGALAVRSLLVVIVLVVVLKALQIQAFLGILVLCMANSRLLECRSGAHQVRDLGGGWPLRGILIASSGFWANQGPL